MAIRYPLVLNGTTIEELQLADSIDFTSASISGDLTFTGTGARVKANFSDASIANRLLFQTTVADTPTLIGIIPNGTGVSSAVYGTTNSDPTADASYFDLRVSGVTNQVRLSADRNGTAPYYPIAFYTSGTQQMTLDTSGNLNIAGLTASRALATDASKNLVSSAVTSTELGYLSGVTSAIQTQINGKAGTATANTFTNNQIISVSSSSDALRITQTGTGNALIVEDSTNPDSTPFVIDQYGRTAIGATSSGAPVSGLASGLGVHSIASVNNTLSAYQWSADSTQAFVTLSKSRGATPTTQSILSSGDTIGTLMWTGSDGTQFVQAARVEAAVDGTPGTNDMPGRLVFSTTADGASSPTERMRIDSAGMVTITNSSTSDALRITQTGTGNALVVEDSANPDSTPVVIDNSGFVLAGHTARLNSVALGFAKLQVIGSDNQTAQSAIWRFSADADKPRQVFYKSRSGTIGTNSVVSSSDSLGSIDFYGADGTTYIHAAAIESYVDGTPGTNDMPGRLVFSTTADGASSPTARMVIDNAGRVGIGATPIAARSVLVGSNLTGSTTSVGILASGVAQSDVTSSARYFQSSISTAAAAFTAAEIVHFYANQGTIGATSAVTNQIGFSVASTLTGATNNYGFYSAIASGSGRYNFYAAGTADNYFAGKLLLGSATSVTTRGNDNTFQLQGIAYAQASATISRFNSGSTGGPGFEFNRSRNGSLGGNTVVLSGDTLGEMYFNGADGTAFIPAASIIGQVDGTPGTNDMPGRLVFSTTADGASSPTERMRIQANGKIYFANALGAQNTANLVVGQNIDGATSAFGVVAGGTVQSTVTSLVQNYSSGLRTAAAAFTLTNYNHFIATQQSIGAGSTVTNQYGFQAENSLTGATNNYGFHSNIPSGTGRWNFYAGGTADNFFAGKVGVGGGTPFADTAGISISSNITGGTTANAVNIYALVQSDVTSQARGFTSQIGTAATAFTLGELSHFTATQITLGAGSAVTSQMGFHARAGLTGATNNFGFYSNIASASGRYNFYAAGTAENYFAGATTVAAAIKSTSATGGIGYGTGAGGTVTQTTSRSTGVTLNKICGSITLVSASASVAADFTVTNSTVSATDTVLCTVQASGATVVYQSTAYAVANGSFKIYVASPGSAVETPTVNFSVIKSVTA